MFFACKGTIKWAKYQKKQEFFSGISECEYLRGSKRVSKVRLSERKSKKKIFFAFFRAKVPSFCRWALQKRPSRAWPKRYCVQSLVVDTAICPSLFPCVLHSLHIQSLSTASPVQHPFNVLSTLFRGHKNVSYPIFSGTWVGDEWDMSGTHIGEKDSKFPLFSLVLPSKRWAKGGGEAMNLHEKGKGEVA